MFRNFQNYRFVLTLTVLTAATFAGSSFAQRPDDYRNEPPGPFHQPVPTIPVESGFAQDHSSTAAEGFLRGKAQVIQSLGNFQLSKSQADILRQQARWLDRENDLRQTEALLAQQKLWSDARTQAEAAQKARLAEGRKVLAERKSTVLRKQFRLSPNQIDMATGIISWPTFMQTEAFAPLRAEIEQLVHDQVRFGNNPQDSSDEIAHTVDSWSRALERGRTTLPRDEYFAAQKFLTGIKYTTATVEQNVAANRTIVPRAVSGGTLAGK